MTEKIENGDYVKCSDKIGLVQVEYIDELVQTASQILTVRKGSFYPNKNYGSHIWLANKLNPSDEYALAFAREALDTLDGVYVKSANIVDDILNLTLIINETERQVAIKLENNL